MPVHSGAYLRPSYARLAVFLVGACLTTSAVWSYAVCWVPRSASVEVLAGKNKQHRGKMQTYTKYAQIQRSRELRTVSLAHRFHERTIACVAKTAVLAAVAMLAAACSSGQPASTTSSSTGALSHHHRKGHARAETVTALLPGSITVREPNGTLKSFVISSATVFREGHTRGSESLVAVGDRVRVGRLAGAAQPTAKIVIVLPAQVIGAVTKVTSGGFTMTSANGTTESVVTSSSTTYRMGRSTVSSSSLHPGDRVRVLGSTSATDSITAKIVAILPAGGKHAGRSASSKG
jgi:hypothetical protein